MAFYTSTYFNTKVIEHVLKNTSFSSTSGWLGLYTNNPTTGAGELSSYNYSRIQVPFTVSGSTAINTGAINFSRATGEWNTINYYGILNASVSGSLLFYGELSIPRKIYSTETFFINAGELYIGLGVGYSNYLAGKLLNHVLNNTNYTSPGLDIFSALYTVLPNASDTGGTEVNGVNYNRLRVSGSSWTSTPGSNTEIIASTIIDLDYCSDSQYSWGEIKGLCLRDSFSAGNQLFRGSFIYPPTVVIGDSYNIKAGDLAVKVG